MTPESIANTLLHHYGKPSFAANFHQVTPHVNIEILRLLGRRAFEFLSTKPRYAVNLAGLLELVADQLGSNDALSYAALIKGSALNAAGQYEESLKYNRLAEKISRADNNLARAVALQINRVATLCNMGLYQKAIVLAVKARSGLEQAQFPNLSFEANLECSAGDAYGKIGQFETAFDCYQRAQKIYTSLDLQNQVADVITNKALIWLEQGNFQTAASLFEKARAIYEEIEFEQNVAIVDVNRGMLEHYRGNYLKALNIIESARDKFLSEKDFLYVADADLHRSFIYLDLNLLEEATHLARETERIYRRHKDRWQAIQAMIVQAKGWQYADQYELAQQYFDKARRWLIRLDAKPMVHHLDIDRANLSLMQHDIRRAKRIGRRLSKLDTVQSAELLSLKVQLLLANCAIKSQPPDLVGVQQHCEIGFQLAQTLGMTEVLIQFHAVYGQYWAILGDFSQAEQHYLTALEMLERQRRTLQLDMFQIHYLESKLPFYQNYITMLHNQEPEDGRMLPKLVMALNLKHAAPFSRKSENLTNEKPDGLRQKLQQAQQQWYWLHQNLEKPFQQKEIVSANRVTIETVPQEVSLQSIEVQIADLVKRIQLHSVTQSKASLNLSLHQSDLENPTRYVQLIQATLTGNQALIHFYEADEACHALLIFQTTIDLVSDLCASSFLQKFMRAWHFFTGSLVGKISPDKEFETAHDYLAQLYDRLLQRLRPFLTNIDAVQIVIPPTWHQLPLAAAYDGSHYWGQLVQMTFITSLDAALHTRISVRQQDEPLHALLVAHSANGRLSHTHQEITQLQHLLTPSWNVTAYAEHTANLSNTKSTLAQNHLIHIAAHAVFRADNPLFSWIQLQDGQLTLVDIEQIHFTHDPLVVLSACESGRGVPKGGGLLGMARSFLTAGASGLIVTQWQVEDKAASSLMSAFYETDNWLQQPAMALQAAQNELIQKNVSPVYWCNFIYIGG